MLEYVTTEPWWLQAWIYWLALVNTVSLFLLKRRVEARWVLAAWIGGLLIMGFLYETLGYVRLLGLAHLLVWPPLLFYLYRRRSEAPPAEGSVLTRVLSLWLVVLFFTNLVSLAFDTVDVVRYVVAVQGVDARRQGSPFGRSIREHTQPGLRRREPSRFRSR